MSDIKTYDPYYAGPAVLDASGARTPSPVAPEPAPEPVEAKTNEPEEVEQATAPAEALEVPEGSAAKILGWVGEDRERASAALAAEEAGQARKTLVAKLQAILEG